MVMDTSFLLATSSTASPSADLIEAHREWLEVSKADNTVNDACDLLYRLDRDLADMQRAAGERPEGLAGALEEELVAWLRCPQPGRQGRWKKQETWSRSTRKTYRAHIVRYYRWATSGPEPRLSYDPSANLLAPKVYEPDPQPATDEQVAYIERYADDPHWLHCMLGARQGFRPSDVANARREHFTMQPMLIDSRWVEVATVRVRGKGDKPAVLPVDPLIWEAVRDLPSGPIARPPKGATRRRTVMTAHDVTVDVGVYLHRDLGMSICMRSLRAWYATTMLNRHKNHRVVQELMRHSSLQTLQRYAAVVEAQKRAAVFTLPTFGGRAAAGEGADAVAGGSSVPGSPG
jgi:integrase/recombinase XerC